MAKEKPYRAPNIHLLLVNLESSWITPAHIDGFDVNCSSLKLFFTIVNTNTARAKPEAHFSGVITHFLFPHWKLTLGTVSQGKAWKSCMFRCSTPIDA